MSMPEIGTVAPEFDLASSDGGRFRLSDQRGRIIVLYFYPSDDTPGCTDQAVGFTARLDEFTRAGAVVAGVSPDSIESHLRFSAKRGLGVTLLSDPDHLVIETYGAWAMKTMFARRYMGVVRSTVIIDADGRIAKTWSKVRVKGHVEAVLEAVRGLSGH